jgi:hypothetical protein
VAEAENIWKTKLPLKIKIFLWQLHHDKLQVATSLKNRGWKGAISCCLCGKPESARHVFFECSLARFAWGCLRDALGWDRCPMSASDLLGDGFAAESKVPKHVNLFIFEGMSWAIWRARNKMAIEKSFPKTPLEVIWSGISFVQKWRLLLNEAEQTEIDGLGMKMKTWLDNFLPSEAPVSDIVEL